MLPVLSLLKCWVSGKDSSDITMTEHPEAVLPKHESIIQTDVFYSPLPHFYEETRAYLRGDVTVLNKLPAVQAGALKISKQSATRVVVVSKEKNGSSSQDRAKMFARLRTRSQETREQAFHVLKTAGRRTVGRITPTLPPVTDKPAFSEMVRHEILLVVTQASPSPRSVTNGAPNTSSFNANAAITTRGVYPVYDGLRSSPPVTRTGPHTWKPYTGIRSPHKTEDPEDHGYATEQPSPQLGYATEARRATAKLITTHRRDPLPTIPPTPRLPSASIVPPLPPAAPFQTYGRPLSQNHYTSPQSTSLLSTLKSRLLIPTSGPASLTTAELLANLLFRWPETRRDLFRFDPILAQNINEIDWTGVEGEFHGGSFTQRLVEAWVWSGEGLFGEWRGPWGRGFGLPW